MLPLLLAALVLAGCKGSKATDYEVTYLAFQSESDGDWGMMDTQGNVLFSDMIEGSPGPAINDRFYVYDQDEGVWCIYAAEQRPRKIGEFKDVGCFTIDLCPVVSQDNEMYYIDKEGNKAFDLNKINGKKVVSAYAFFNGRAQVRLENGKSGYIDETGQTVIPCKYYDANPFSEGVALVMLDDDEADNRRWAIIDTEGNTLFTKKYNDYEPVTTSYSEGYIIARSNSKLALIDKQGNVVHRVKGTSAQDVHNGHFVVYDEDSGKYGLASVEGQMVIRPRYSSMEYNGAFLVGTNDDERYYLLTLTGDKIARLPKGTPILFDKHYANWDKCFLVGEYGESYKFIGPDGTKLDISTDISSVNYGFFTLAIASAEEEEGDYDYEDYEEEEMQ